MTYKVKLTKIKSSHSNLRTDTVEGEARVLPVKGGTFSLIGESLTTPGYGGRLVYTTEIQSVEVVGKEYRFTTQNSEYKLEVLEEIP